MKKLLILRHAKSSWNHPHLADHDRPLNQRGQAAAPWMGQLLYEEDLVPDVILSSTARRARDTADLVAEASGFAGELVLLESLYHAGPDDYLAALETLPDEVELVMVVGHNPGMEILLEDLTGESERMPTAALALVHLPVKHWSDLTEEINGTLRGFWTPREL